MVELCGDAGMQTKREYSAQGVAILAWKLPPTKKNAAKENNAADKNGHLEQGKSARIAAWGKTAGWKVHAAECTIFGVDADSLRDHLSSEL